jgi:hypothetical protein
MLWVSYGPLEVMPSLIPLMASLSSDISGSRILVSNNWEGMSKVSTLVVHSCHIFA